MFSSVSEIEQTIRQLPITEQLWLVERIVRSIREYEITTLSGSNEADIEDELRTMALDPAIQSELAIINQEFSVTEMDGLLEP